MTKSMFNLSDFKATIKSNGVARDTRFEVIVFPPTQLQLDSKELSIRCHTASLPAFNVKTRDYIVGQGQLRKMPVNFDNGNTMEFSFYNDYKGKVYSDLVDWTKLVTANISENDHTINFVSLLYGKIIVRQLDEKDNVRQGWELKDAYPIAVENIQLDSGHIDHVQLVKIQVAYRYAMTIKEVERMESVPLSTTAFKDRNDAFALKIRSSNPRNTSNGSYTKRNRKYSPFDTQDPTMISIVTDANRGKGIPPSEFYAYLTQYVSTTRAKGNGIYTEDQMLWLQDNTQSMNDALETNDRITISSEFAIFTSTYNDVKNNADVFFGDVSSCVNNYNSIKGTLVPTDPLISNIFDLQFVYNNVFNKQLEVDNTFGFFNEKVNSFNASEISFSLM